MTGSMCEIVVWTSVKRYTYKDLFMKWSYTLLPMYHIFSYMPTRFITYVLCGVVVVVVVVVVVCVCVCVWKRQWEWQCFYWIRAICPVSRGWQNTKHVHTCITHILRRRTYTNIFSLSVSLTYTLTHTHSLSLSLSLSHTHTLTHTHARTQAHTHTHTHTHAGTHIHTCVCHIVCSCSCDIHRRFD